MKCMAILSNGDPCPKNAVPGTYIYHGDSELYSDWEIGGLRVKWVHIPLCAPHLEWFTRTTIGGGKKESYESYLKKLRADRKTRGLYPNDVLEDAEKELVK